MSHLTAKSTRNTIIGTILIATLSACASEDNGGTSNSSRSTIGTYPSASEALAPCKELAQETENLEALADALTSLADNGEPCAQFGLGTLYRLGYDTIPSNSHLAQTYLQLAADQGYPNAQYELDAM